MFLMACQWQSYKKVSLHLLQGCNRTSASSAKSVRCFHLSNETAVLFWFPAALMVVYLLSSPVNVLLKRTDVAFLKQSLGKSSVFLRMSLMTAKKMPAKSKQNRKVSSKCVCKCCSVNECLSLFFAVLSPRLCVSR